jgi:hypothetical protein
VVTCAPLAGEIDAELGSDVGAEGATAPETLRQKDRRQQQNIWKATRILAMSLRPPKG